MPQPRIIPLSLLPATLALALGMSAAGPAAAQADYDICACRDRTDTLGAFDAATEATWPPGTVIEPRHIMTVPLPEDGVLVFDSIKAESWYGTSYIVFKRNARNTPVTILVKGDALIGNNLWFYVGGDDGSNGSRSRNGTGGKPGPGGWRGGDGAYRAVNGAALGGEGQGPGGGKPGTAEPLERGLHGSNTVRDDLRPLIGGSGGGGGASAGDGNCSGSGGGGGGGALLIAVNGTLTINGGVDADGGRHGGYTSNNECASHGGYGGGGSIRILARQVAGNGYVRARGGRGDSGALPGRIRIESLTEDQFRADHIEPPAMRSSVIGPLVNPVETSIAITAIGGESVPQVLSAIDGGVDVVLPAPGEVTFQVETVGVPAGTMVEVAVKPRVGGEALRESGELSASACTGDGACKAFVTFTLPGGAYYAEAIATFQSP